MLHEGLVFGKFYPLHQGHLALIDFALKHCKRVTVVVCATDSEHIDGETRKLWIEMSYLLERRVEPIHFPYDESVLPNTSVSSREVSRVWAEQFSRMLPDVTAVFTSEPYGEYVAEYMQIAHFSFNPERNIVPVSATQIRQHPLTYWQYLSEAAQPEFVQRIALLGTESTGKSTLARELAEHFGVDHVQEAARDMVPNSEKVSYPDLQDILKAQTEAVQAATFEASMNDEKFIFVDTALPTTRAYSQYLFQKELYVPPKREFWLRADLYLVLDREAPYVQDGSRLPEKQRNALQDALEREIEGLENVVWIRGNDWQDRRQQAIAAVEHFLKQR
jgi:HTH-type transcriptional repressor of NAD biosynthesis genes